MKGRFGVAVLCFALFAAGLAAGAIRADPTDTLPSTTDTTTEPTTIATTTAPTVTTTTVAATTAPTTATTTRAEPTQTVESPLPLARPPGGDCLLAAAFVVTDPRRHVRIIGPIAKAPHRGAALAGAGYPRDGSIATAAAVSARSSKCQSGSSDVRSMSLFGGAITARAVSLSVRGSDVTGRIDGLAVRNRRIVASPGLRLRLGTWGYAITLGYPKGTPTSGASALAVHVVRRHAGLAAGTVLQVAFAVAPAPAKSALTRSAKRARAHPATNVKRTRRHHRVRIHHRARKRHRGEPLKVTPFLGVTRYVFPVTGQADYGDSYGGYRGDVPGNWHHGDDIFAPLGTPVVAVADGTLNRVGWERLGGWRLWVRDAMRNEFYYAHLSGYSPLALHSRRVKKGEVIGFIGNTGDAFTTPPHLHFEIHPHQLLSLDYNGAVDPTSYLDGWRHIGVAHAPTPAHPSFPGGVVRKEARFVWRRLLAARGLIPHAPALSQRPGIRVPRPDTATKGRQLAARPPSVRHASGFPLIAGFAGLLALLAVCGTTVLLRIRRVPS